jgi:hypothetical protein
MNFTKGWRMEGFPIHPNNIKYLNETDPHLWEMGISGV